MSFQCVARFVFVRYGNRGDVHLRQVLRKWAAVAHSEHFEHSYLCLVVAVLGASIALSYPSRLVLVRDSISHIVRYILRIDENLLRRTSAYYLEHLVYLADIDHYLRTHQIATEGYFRSLDIVGIKYSLQYGGVEYYIAVVGYVCITLLRVDMVDTAVR